LQTLRDFDGVNVVVTGGSGVLGSAVVAHLVDRGARCHVPRRSGKGEEAGRVSYHGGVDLADEAAVRGFYSDLGPIWASIHVAGGFAMAPIADVSLEQLEAMWRINAVTCFLCSREAVAAMRAGGQGGRIVNLASRPALEPTASMAAYAASKAAVVAMTGAIAEEVVGEDILVNSVAPSIIDTPQNREAMPGADFDRWPKPAEIAATVAFLASPGNRLTTATTVPVYGKA
jgi:NAD(P)-dependent dehydrogenase (short-subunit alcohol dehydrogenase family)